MSQRAYGSISFGIMLKWEYRCPWHADPYNWELEEWWVYEHGLHYVDTQPSGLSSDEDIQKLREKKREILERYPIPVTEVVCDCYRDLAIIAVPSSVYKECGVFDPDDLKVSEIEVDALLDFVKKYLPDQLNTPQWHFIYYEDY